MENPTCLLLLIPFGKEHPDICFSFMQDFWPQCHLRTTGMGTGWPTLQENSSLGPAHQVNISIIWQYFTHLIWFSSENITTYSS